MHLIAGFMLLRATNLYGDPAPWGVQETSLGTLLSFINWEKYPPSLLYLMMTLGPALVLLALFEHVRHDAWLAFRTTMTPLLRAGAFLLRIRERGASTNALMAKNVKLGNTEQRAHRYQIQGV